LVLHTKKQLKTGAKRAIRKRDLRHEK
jgi:hypothetical protein